MKKKTLLEFLGYWYAILHSTCQVNIYDTCITTVKSIRLLPYMYLLGRSEHPVQQRLIVTLKEVRALKFIKVERVFPGYGAVQPRF